MSAALCNVNPAIWSNHDPCGRVELARFAAKASPLCKKNSLRRELPHPMPPELRGINVICLVDGDAVWTIEA